MHDGVPINLDSAGRAEIIAGDPGKSVLTATATDEDGFVATAVESLRVRDVSDLDPPELSLSLSSANSLDQPVDVVASIDDVNLDHWTLSIRPYGQAEFTALAEGDEAVFDAQAVYQLDPTRIANGYYTLRLFARDVSGRPAEQTLEVEINSAEKNDAFIRTDVDAEFTVGDKTLSIARQYDSLQQDVIGDLGPGWRFVFGDTRLQLSTQDPIAMRWIQGPTSSNWNRSVSINRCPPVTASTSICRMGGASVLHLIRSRSKRFRPMTPLRSTDHNGSRIQGFTTSCIRRIAYSREAVSVSTITRRGSLIILPTKFSVTSPMNWCTPMARWTRWTPGAR